MSNTASEKTEQIALRIGLDQTAASSYDTMIGRLHAENEHVKVSPSRYVSFVMKRYFDHYFENDLKFIARHFFDSKDYLASELRKAKSSDELRAALEKFMNDTKPIEDKPKRGRTKKVDADQV